LRLHLPAQLPVDVAVFDVAGRRVRELLRGVELEGWQSIEWDGRDDVGRETAPGVYFIRLMVGGEEVEQRIARVR
jgi:flagellar hook assembly protein FlgD